MRTRLPGADLDAFTGERGATQQKVKSFGGQTALGRPGQPAEVASIYVRLAANGGSYANGNIYGSSAGSGQP